MPTCLNRCVTCCLVVACALEEKNIKGRTAGELPVSLAPKFLVFTTRTYSGFAQNFVSLAATVYNKLEAERLGLSL